MTTFGEEVVVPVGAAIAAYLTYEAARFAGEVADKTMGKIIDDGGVLSEVLVPTHTVLRPALSILEKVEPLNFAVPIVAKAGFSKIYHGAADIPAHVAASLIIPAVETADRFLLIRETLNHPVTSKIVGVAQIGANLGSTVLKPIEAVIDAAHNVVDTLNPINYILSEKVTTRFGEVLRGVVDFAGDYVPSIQPITGTVRNFLEGVDLSDASFTERGNGFVNKLPIVGPTVDWIQDIVDALNPINYALSEEVTVRVDDVARGVADKIVDIVNNIPVVGVDVPQTLADIVNIFIEAVNNIPGISIDTSREIFDRIADVINNIPDVNVNIPQVVADIMNMVVDSINNMPLDNNFVDNLNLSILVPVSQDGSDGLNSDAQDDNLFSNLLSPVGEIVDNTQNMIGAFLLERVIETPQLGKVIDDTRQNEAFVNPSLFESYERDMGSSIQNIVGSIIEEFSQLVPVV